MALYELRTYTLYVGKMAEATKLYQELGFPAFQKGGHDKKLIGLFPGRHRHDQPARASVEVRRRRRSPKHWAAVFANKDFVEGFASKFRPLVDVAGGQAADRGAVGPASVTAAASTNARRCSRLPTR